MFCAPGIKKKKTGCFDRQALIRIANAYNVKYPNQAIRINQSMSESEIWSKVRDNFEDVCGDNESCWLDQTFLKDDEQVQDYYKPLKPEKPTQWLSTADINRVLKQYESVNEDFAFMGTVPIDFDKVMEEYSKMDLCSLYHGKGLKMSNGKIIYDGPKIRRFGFVFNLDPHYKRGSHWVSMFMDLTASKPFIGYFDSFGYCPPPLEITNLMNRLKKQAKACLGIDLIKYCNSIRHQYKNTECGSYALYFIYNCLLGKSFAEITENIILDDDVNKYRDFFFRPRISGDLSN